MNRRGFSGVRVTAIPSAGMDLVTYDSMTDPNKKAVYLVGQPPATHTYLQTPTPKQTPSPSHFRGDLRFRDF